MQTHVPFVFCRGEPKNTVIYTQIRLSVLIKTVSLGVDRAVRKLLYRDHTHFDSSGSGSSGSSHLGNDWYGRFQWVNQTETAQDQNMIFKSEIFKFHLWPSWRKSKKTKKRSIYPLVSCFEIYTHWTDCKNMTKQLNHLKFHRWAKKHFENISSSTCSYVEIWREKNNGSDTFLSVSTLV